MFQSNPDSGITGNSMSRDGIYSPVKSSQHYQKVHTQPWDLFLTEIQAVAIPEIPHPAMGIIFQ